MGYLAHVQTYVTFFMQPCSIKTVYTSNLKQCMPVARKHLVGCMSKNSNDSSRHRKRRNVKGVKNEKIFPSTTLFSPSFILFWRDRRSGLHLIRTYTSSLQVLRKLSETLQHRLTDLPYAHINANAW